MKMSLIILLFVIAISQSFSQSKIKEKKYTFSAGMGISMIDNPSFNSYLKNVIPYTNKDSIKSFSVGLEFFGSLGYQVSKNFDVKLDYAYFIKSLSYTYSYFLYDFFYSIHEPGIMAYYVIPGKHYKFKIGAGGSYLIAQLDQNSQVFYKTQGVGIRGELLYATELSNNLGTYLSGFVFSNITSSLKKDGETLKDPVTNEAVNLSGFGAGVRLGLSYRF